MNRSDFQQLADIRVNEAQVLLNSAPPQPDGAYYLAGYGVECALKACIAKRIDQYDWPEKKFVQDIHTHNLVSLLQLARLDVLLKADAATNATLATNWILVAAWNEQCRYVRSPLSAAQDLVNAISDSSNGVLPWIKVHW